MSKRRLELSEGTSNKFWEAHLDGKALVVRFGRIGSAGREQRKAFASPGAAAAALERAVAEKLGKGYRELRGTAAKAATPEGKPAKNAPKYPFRFYGLAPRDWYEGANCGHTYEVCFASAPDARTRGAIAEAFEAAIADTTIAAGGKEAQWRWAGTWATFSVGQAGTIDAKKTFADMVGAFEALHRVAPIQEVIFHGVKAAGKDRWEAWSVAQQPVPSAAPRWPGSDFTISVFGAKQPRVAAKSAIGPAFEAARERVRKASRTTQATAAAAKAMKARTPALVPVDEDDLPSPPEPPAKEAKLFPKNASPFVVGNRTWGELEAALGSYLAWAESGKLKKVDLGNCKGFAVSDDGARALAIDGDTVHEIVPPSTKKVALIARPGGNEPEGVGYGADDTIVVLTMYKLLLYRRAKGGLEELAAVKLSGGSELGTFRRGTLAVVTTYPATVHLFRIANRTLSKVASLESDVVESFSVDERVFVAGGDDVFEVVNV